LAGTDCDDDRAARRMVSGGGLSSGLLGRRRPAQSLLSRRHPAQAPEAAQKLRAAGEGLGGGLSGGCRTAQPIVDGDTEPLFWDARDRNFGQWLRISLVEKIEQASRSLRQITGR